MSVSTVLGLLFALILVSFLLSALLYRRDPEFGKVISAVQALISIGALIVAAYWYFVERKDKPHVAVRVSAQVAPLGKQAALVLARVDVENSGSGLLTITDREVRLLAARMSDGTLNTILSLPADQFPPTLPSGRELFDNGEIAWKGLRQYHAAREIQIEPTETDSIFVDFVVPCSETLVKLSASVRKPGKEDLWYKDRKLIALAPICQGNDAQVDLQPVKVGEKP
jgi:hypothetical protein